MTDGTRTPKDQPKIQIPEEDGAGACHGMERFPAAEESSTRPATQGWLRGFLSKMEWPGLNYWHSSGQQDWLGRQSENIGCTHLIGGGSYMAPSLIKSTTLQHLHCEQNSLPECSPAGMAWVRILTIFPARTGSVFLFLLSMEEPFSAMTSAKTSVIFLKI